MTPTASPFPFADGDELKTLMAMVVIQMLPLFLLEAKLASCNDQVAFLSACSGKVLMMHMCFLGIRVGFHPFAEMGCGCWNLLGLLASLIIMVHAYHLRPSLSCLVQYKDVGCLVLLAVCAALGTEAINATFRGMPPSTEMMQFALEEASDYIEILAFVPALWVGKGIMMEST